MEWFVFVDGVQKGPLNDSQLIELARSGFLKPHDLVCSRGAQWCAATLVPGLFSTPALSPTLVATPVAPVAEATPPFNGGSVANAGALTAKKRAAAGRRSTVSFFTTCAAILVGGAAAMYVYFNLHPLMDRIRGRGGSVVAHEDPGSATDEVLIGQAPQGINPPEASTLPVVRATTPVASRNAADSHTTSVQSVTPNLVDAVAMLRVQATDRSPIFCSGFVVEIAEGKRGFITCLDGLRPGRPTAIVFGADRIETVAGFLAVLPEQNLVLLEVHDSLARAVPIASAQATVGDNAWVAGVRSITGAVEATATQLRAAGRNSSDLSVSRIPSSTYHGGPVINAAGEILGVLVAADVDNVRIVGGKAIAELLSKEPVLRPLEDLVSAPAVSEPPTVAASSEPKKPVTRTPLPSATEVEQSEELFAEVYGDRVANAKKAGTQLDLINELLSAVAMRQDDAATRYVLLRKSQALAVDAADVASIRRIVAVLSTEFELDATEESAAAFEDAAKSSPPTFMPDLLTTIFEECEEAMRHDRHAIASRYLSIARTALERSINKSLAKPVDRLAERLAAAKKEWDEVQAAMAIIETMPDDRAANLTLGRYLCFTKGKWEEGFAALAKGADDVLVTLAELSLANPKEAEKQTEIGDAWWNAAEEKKDDVVRASELRQGCRYWYERAVDRLTGLSKTRLEMRLKTIGTGRGPSSELPRSVSGRLQKEALTAAYGGTRQTEAAVQSALTWLADHQLADGQWSLTGRDSANKAAYTKGSSYENVAAATAMSLMAFVGAGETHQSGQHSATINRGLQSLLRLQDKQGNFFHEARVDDALYTQAQCLIVLCELYGLSGDEALKSKCELALKYVLGSQDPVMGGWRYRPRSDSDTSVTGWMVSALHAAQDAGLTVPQENLDLASSYLDKAARGSNPAANGAQLGSKYAYQPGMDYDRVMTAEGLLCRIHMGWPKSDPRLTQGCELLLGHLPEWRDRDCYYWYHATQTMFHMQGRFWTEWNRALRAALLSKQQNSGAERGSWDPLDGEGPDLWSINKHGGRLYVTALSAMMLEVYYRHPPFFVATAPATN